SASGWSTRTGASRRPSASDARVATIRHPVAGVLVPVAAAAAAALAYRPILHAYFFGDDFAWLYLIRNAPLGEVLVRAMGGHSLAVRNAAFVLLYRLVGPEPVAYFCTTLIAHTANVLLLHRVIRLATGSIALAGLGAVLFGISPAAGDTLSWYSAAGQVAATTCVLAVLCRLLRRGTAAEPLTRVDWLFCGALLLVGSQLFGTTLPIVVTFTLVVWLLVPATKSHTAAVA